MPRPSSDALCDAKGQPLLFCVICARPLSISDLIDQSLRVPDPGETRADYLDEELLDDLSHVACLRLSQSA